MEATAENLHRFARLLLLTPQEPFKAALNMTEDTGAALRMAHFWPTRPEVIEERRRILEEEGDSAFMPTRFDIVSEAWGIARNAQFTDDRLKALELVAKVTDNMPKAGPAVAVNVQNNRVLIVKDHGDDDAWEKQLQKQQSALINGEFRKLA